MAGTQSQSQEKTSSYDTSVPLQSGLLQRKCDCGNHTIAGGECSACSKDREIVVQRSAINREVDGSHANVAPVIVHEVLRSAGQPLDTATRAFMEPRFGHDFSNVRVHTDAKSVRSAHEVNALAYTVGQDIVFGVGQYNPATEKGRHLLAHELTHTLQQSATGSISKFDISQPGDAGEREADRQADCVMSSEAPITEVSPSSSYIPFVQRRVGNPAQRPPGLSCPSALSLPPAGVVDLFFDTGVVTLSLAQKIQIDGFVGSWRAIGAGTPIRVDGFASVAGEESLNWCLSCDRAENVRAELINPVSGTVTGIPSGMISFFAQGETDEFSSSAEGHNRRATISTPAPPTPCVPPPCPQPPPGYELRVPPIASHSQCRGACGADCDPDACRTIAPLTLCVPAVTGNCHRTCIYVVTECGSHPACVSHDACYDDCAASGERDLCHQGGVCHCACDVACILNYDTSRCVQWATGDGPQPNRIRYTDPPISSAAITGTCGP